MHDTTLFGVYVGVSGTTEVYSTIPGAEGISNFILNFWSVCDFQVPPALSLQEIDTKTAYKISVPITVHYNIHAAVFSNDLT